MFNKFLHTVFGQFMVRNVDAILDDLSRGVAALDLAVEAHIDLAQKHAAKAEKHDRLSATASGEADRAARVARKIRDLIA
jgi:hypothetical protein